MWPREKGTICPFGVFSLVYCIFAQNCNEASCNLVAFSLVSQAYQLVLGSWNPEFSVSPFQPKMAKFESKCTINLGKKRQKDKFHFHACTRGAVALSPPKRVAGSLTSEILSRSRGWSSYTCECRATLRH